MQRTDNEIEDLEQNVLEEINRARRDPSAVADVLRERLTHYQGNDYYPPERGGKTAVVTKEGQLAVRDAIKYLDKRSHVSELSDCGPSGRLDGLRLAAEDHLSDLGGHGTVGHKGADGSHSKDRISRYGNWSGKCGECLWFGSSDANAETIVRDLIVDDGVPDRGHRLGLYDDAFRIAGVRWGVHKTFGACCVITFATGFEDRSSKVAARVSSGPPRLPTPVDAPTEIKTQWNLGKCPGCGETIHGGSVMEVLGNKWHAACFVCTADDCRKSLRGVPFKDRDNMPYCNDCYYERFGEICAGCGRRIHGGFVTARGDTWHKECFKGHGGTQMPLAFNPKPRVTAKSNSSLALPKGTQEGSRAKSAPRNLVPTSPQRNATPQRGGTKAYPQGSGQRVASGQRVSSGQRASSAHASRSSATRASSAHATRPSGIQATAKKPVSPKAVGKPTGKAKAKNKDTAGLGALIGGYASLE